MHLDYLDFEYSEDEDGAGCWDALASVTHERLPALTREVESLLRWADQTFPGRRAPLEEGGDWDCELQIQQGDGPLQPMAWEACSSRLLLTSLPDQRTTLALTLSASPAFSEALRAHCALDGP